MLASHITSHESSQGYALLKICELDFGIIHHFIDSTFAISIDDRCQLLRHDVKGCINDRCLLLRHDVSGCDRLIDKRCPEVSCLNTTRPAPFLKTHLEMVGIQLRQRSLTDCAGSISSIECGREYYTSGL